ncbi:MAG TPA: hypothetical protein PLP73_00300 [Candidatus Absconditabacterales bacterium]|nr:hypothetical protein [Candidatus Absconditabacterales bacterium]HRU50019.1 hypothetical protein [Candidatus Absconditabacterales bacterium]
MCPTNSPGYRDKKRGDGKTNYEHYQGTKKRRKYRSKLNTENRKRGDYGNGDGKDLSHVDNNPNNFSKGNLKKVSQKVNRKKGAEKANRKKGAKIKYSDLYV